MQVALPAFITGAVLAVAIVSAPLAFSVTKSSSPTAGKVCSKLGATYKSSTKTLKCVKSGRYFVWKVMTATKPKPVKTSITPSASPIATTSPTASSLPAQSSYDVSVASSQWSFAFTYFVDGSKVARHSAPGDSGVLYIPLGKVVHFTLTSADTTHGFWVPGLSIDIAMDPGASGHLDFTASKVGTFPGRCNVSSCGRGHAGMAFTVKVVTADDYLKYLSSLK